MFNQYSVIPEPPKPRPEFTAVGKHLLLELSGCNAEVLNDKKWILNVLNLAATEAKCHAVKEVTQEFTPQGISCVLVLEESHISIHTWPEHGHASIDFYTCGDNVSPVSGEKILVEALGATAARKMLIDRGNKLGVVVNEDVTPNAESVKVWMAQRRRGGSPIMNYKTGRLVYLNDDTTST